MDKIANNTLLNTESLKSSWTNHNMGKKRLFKQKTEIGLMCFVHGFNTLEAHTSSLLGIPNITSTKLNKQGGKMYLTFNIR